MTIIGLYHIEPPSPITRTVTQVFPVKIVPEHLPLLFYGCKYGTKRLRDFLFSLLSKIYAFSAKKGECSSIAIDIFV